MEAKPKMTRKSGFDLGQNSKEFPSLGALRLGQNYPQHYPHREESRLLLGDDILGEPLSVRGVAKLIGCSAWTIRQRYLPAGLPHHRLTRNGKLIFYKQQVIRWLLNEQQKGGRAS